jgi:hypothetical protein
LKTAHFFLLLVLAGLAACIGQPIDEAVSGMYHRAWGSVYYTPKSGTLIVNGNKIKGADAKTFTPLAETVGADKHTVYFRIFPQPQVDRATFRVLEDGTMRDKDHIYIPSFSDGDESKLKPLYNVDTDTYGSFKGHAGWGYDKNQVYCRYSTPVDVDRETFVFLSDNYMKDKNYVYAVSFDGLKKRQMNTDSIQAVSALYLRDNRRVYYFDVASGDFLEIPFDAPKSVQPLAGPYIIVDGQVYSNGKLLNGGEADASTFTCLDAYYSRDDKHVFYDNAAIPNADAAGFEALQEGMAKDTHSVYYMGRKLAGVDPGSLRIVNPLYFADRNHVYFIRSRPENADFFFVVENADPASFACNPNKGFAFGYDKKNEYYNGMTVVSSSW